MIISGIVSTGIEWLEVDLMSPMKKSVLFFVDNRRIGTEGNIQKVNIAKWYSFQIEVKANKFNTSKYSIHHRLDGKLNKFVEIKGRGDFIIKQITFESL